jgi:hypothetical protein
MVQAMARQERRSVSEMIMVLVTAEVAKRMQEQACAPPRKRFPGKPRPRRATDEVTP